MQDRGYSLKVPPTVIQELTYFALDKQCSETPMALRALEKMRSWGMEPWNLRPAGHAIAEQFSKNLIKKGFLPDGEFNDGLILAETSLASIPVLASCDGHLLGIDPAFLRIQFENSDLFPVSVFHPKALLAALK